MYIPHYYKNENVAEVKEFLKHNSFGILVSQLAGKPWGTHIPMELDVDEDGKDILMGHIAKANMQWKDFETSPEVLCIFNGPHAYISSSWYREEEVPTWNYIAVHVYGTIRIMDDEALLRHLKKLVDKYEAASKNPVALEQLSPKTLRQTSGVVGCQIDIKEIQAAYKLSQTRENDHHAIITELEQRDFGSKAIASAMKRTD